MTALRVLGSRRWSGWTVDRHASLMALFQPLGGVAEGNAMAARLRDRHSQPLSLLGRWIVDRQVIHFNLQSTLFLPLFQFDASQPACGRCAPAPGIREVLAELDPCFDEWEVAEWFATGNAWLQYQTPAGLVAEDAVAVVQAARADRYIARGW